MFLPFSVIYWVCVTMVILPWLDKAFGVRAAGGIGGHCNYSGIWQVSACCERSFSCCSDLSLEFSISNS
jgi:hypothetical protein